jgi:hypothetical protein
MATGGDRMHGMTRDGVLGAVVAILGVGIWLGWGAGRAYQRAVDAWWRFRNHLAMTRYMFRRSVDTAIEAAVVLLLVGGAVAGVGATVWWLT